MTNFYQLGGGGGQPKKYTHWITFYKYRFLRIESLTMTPYKERSSTVN